LWYVVKNAAFGKYYLVSTVSFRYFIHCIGDNPVRLGGEVKKNLFAGIFVILIGIVLLLSEIFNYQSQNYFLLILGVVFVAAYFYRNRYGYLIPGCILLGISVGEMFNFPTIGLGLGFSAIYIIHKLYRKTSHWWPLVPGVVLIGIGLQEHEYFGKISFTAFLGIILIILGIVVLFRKKTDENNPSDY
jgi:drug/metabolite transporter (DMT)-like permease